jgi:hypothetical protein
MASAPKTAAEQLVAAVSSPFNAGKIRMRIDPRYSASPPDSKTKQRSPLLRIGLHVDGRDLVLGEAESGKKKLVYSALVIVANQDGKTHVEGGQDVFIRPDSRTGDGSSQYRRPPFT